MRKYLEEEMLAEQLKGRIRYNCTSYVGMDGCRLFEVYIDNKLVKRFSWETVNSWFILQGYKGVSETRGLAEYWKGFWSLLKGVPLSDRDEYTDEEFCEALTSYRNQSILDSIRSENPLIRMFAILDRRVGKRTLVRLKDEIGRQPEWLREFYRLRLDCEKISQIFWGTSENA